MSILYFQGPYIQDLDTSSQFRQNKPADEDVNVEALLESQVTPVEVIQNTTAAYQYKSVAIKCVLGMEGIHILFQSKEGIVIIIISL